MLNNRVLFVSVASAFLLVGGLMGGCTSSGAGDGERDVAMASLDEMPTAVKRAPATVRQAYQFAVANPEVLTQIPCYCGCGGMGHTSNYSCYVAVNEDGTRQFDGHGLGCSICVDIALDTMRLLKKGQTARNHAIFPIWKTDHFLENRGFSAPC